MVHSQLNRLLGEVFALKRPVVSVIHSAANNRKPELLGGKLTKCGFCLLPEQQKMVASGDGL